MIMRPVIGSSTSLTIGISMKRTQITPLWLSQRRPPISRDLGAGERNMFVGMDLSLKYSQRRNFFHSFEQKKTKFSEAGELSRSPPIYAPE